MLTPEVEAEIDDCCDRYEALWLAGETPNLPQFLEAASPAARPHLLPELAALERHYRRNERGESVSYEQLAVIYPELADELDGSAPTLSPIDATARPQASAGPLSDVVLADDAQGRGSLPSRGLHVRCPHCSNGMEILADSPYTDITCRTCGSTFNLVAQEEPTNSAATLRQLGRFELVSRLGVGGFGTVWKARDTELDRLVAVKIPRKGQLSPGEIEQFFREARAAAQLSHRNIVSVYEVGREEDTVFIVSDFVRGVSLADYLTGVKPTHRETATLGIAIAEALAHAHDHGVIHRDLKPSNIMLDESGTPRIMDFGLAKRDVGEITMTVEGQILGTPGYMSPEQASGQSHWTDRRSDIYSLGTVLFRMMTGELPFRGNARMQLHHKLTSDPPDPRRLVASIPRDLATICLKCIQRDPNHRYGTAREVARELERFLAGEPIVARPLSAMARAWRWARRKPALATACLLGVLAAIGGPLLAWQQHKIARDERVRVAERDELVRRNKETIDDQARTIAGLRNELNALRGGDSGVAETLPGWKISLIKDLVAARQQQMAAELAEGQSSDRASIRAGLGLGMLLAELGRNEEALHTLETTQRRIAQLGEPAELPVDLADAEADCWQRIGELHLALGDDAAARAAFEYAVARRRALNQRDPALVDRQVRLLESTTHEMSTAEPSAEQLARLETMVATVREQIQDNWPTSPEEFYRLACQLTMSDMLLDADE